MFSGIKAILKEFKKRQDAESQKNLVYSQEETDTGKTWIDGKKIYRKVWKNKEIINSLPIGGTIEYTEDFIKNIDSLCETKVIESDSITNLSNWTSGGISVNSINNTSGYFRLKNINITETFSSLVGGTTIIFEYTKK
jgi:hypothetical protein